MSHEHNWNFWWLIDSMNVDSSHLAHVIWYILSHPISASTKDQSTSNQRLLSKLHLKTGLSCDLHIWQDPSNLAGSNGSQERYAPNVHHWIDSLETDPIYLSDIFFWLFVKHRAIIPTYHMSARPAVLLYCNFVSDFFAILNHIILYGNNILLFHEDK